MSRTPVHDWFATDGVRRQLRTHAVRSGTAALAGRGGQVAIQVAAVMVLARLLGPADFGILAMVLPLAILVNGAANLGLQSAVIHDDDIDHAGASALFWFAVRANLAVAALMAATGPLLARVYDEPRVQSVTIVWAALIWVATLGALHEALLKRQMRFGTVMTLQIGALLAGTVTAVAAALLGAGYWALLLQIGVLETGRTLGVWIACDWRPGRPTRGVGARGPRAYWERLSGFRLVSWLGDHPDRILVGWVGGAPVLGLYDVARRWAWYPFIELFLSLSDVAVASFSRVRHDTVRYRAFVARALTPVLSVALPAVAFIFVEARDVVLVLLGRPWLDAVPFVRLMAAAAFVGAGARLTQWLYLSRGETGRLLRWAALVHTPTMLAALGIGVLWGATGVAAAFAAGTAALALPAIAYAVRGSPLSFGDYLRVLARPAFAAAAAAALLVLLAGVAPAGPPLLRLALALAVFLPCYAVIWLALPGGRAAFAGLREAGRELRPRITDATATTAVTSAASASPATTAAQSSSPAGPR